MKQRMASADVSGEVSCLKQRIIGLRLANLYDLNAKVSAAAAAAAGVFRPPERMLHLSQTPTQTHKRMLLLCAVRRRMS